MSKTTNKRMLVKIAILIISIALIASTGWFLRLDWFWFVWDILGAILVSAGCIAEWILLYGEHEYDDANKRTEKAWAVVVAIGVTMDVFGLIYGIPEAIRLENHVADLRFGAARAESNLVVLNNKTLELAHQYDLSTNALAEANVRLASVRPLKQRLTDWLNSVDPTIIPRLKSGQTKFAGNWPTYAIGELDSFSREPGGNLYFASPLVTEPRQIYATGGGGVLQPVKFELTPELVQ